MEQVRIDNAYVRTFPFWGLYGTSLRALADKDYNNCGFFSSMDVDCLDVDRIEIDRAKEKKTTREKTMDSCVGISAIGRNNTRQLLLIELRLDYDSVSNVKFSDCKDKDRYTRSLLSECAPFCDYAIFVFKETVAAQAQRVLYSKQQEDGTLGRLQVVSDKELEEFFVPEDKWPVSCEINKVELAESLKSALERGDEDHLIDFCTYWKEKAIKYYYQYKRQEHDLIVETFKKCLSDYTGNAIDYDLIVMLKGEFD